MASDTSSADPLGLSDVEDEIVQSQIITRIADLNVDEDAANDHAAGSPFEILKAAFVAAEIPEYDAEVLIAKCLDRVATAKKAIADGLTPSIRVTIPNGW
jgi:hypothetical protein